MTRKPLTFEILFEDSHLIAVSKPAGMLIQGDASGTPSLFSAVHRYLKDKSQIKPDPFLGMVHRLDRNVGGVAIFAKTSRAASDLSDQIRRRKVRKFYVCRVEGKPKEEEGQLIHFIRKEKSLKATVFPRQTPDAKRAVLSYRLLETDDATSLLEVELHTGRFHQIRAQLSFIKHPIVGDVKYRASHALRGQRLALFANRLELCHPRTGEPLILEAEPPPGWTE